MQMVLFMGIQGAGKSSFFKERFFNTHVRISLDMLKTKHREQVLLQACLEAKQPFVVDKMNLTRAERQRYIAQAKAAGFSVEGYFFDASVGDALRRNAGRQGPARVPDKAIFGARKHLELPTPAEGFDKLYVVQVKQNEPATVQEWRPELASIPNRAELAERPAGRGKRYLQPGSNPIRDLIEERIREDPHEGLA